MKLMQILFVVLFSLYASVSDAAATRIARTSSDQGQTTGAVTVPLGLFEFPNASIMLVTVKVLAVRADGVTRAWTLTSLIKKTSGTLAVMENIPAPPNVFDSAGDATALGAGVTITLFSDTTYIGVNVTGQAGQTIDWIINLDADGLAL